MEIISSITEAYSMQPLTYKIGLKMPYDSEIIKEIKYETKRTGENEYLNYYVGYNFDGKKLFQYLANSVNVHFK